MNTRILPRLAACLVVGAAFTAQAAELRVTCEKRASRSKASVDGSDLAAGQYRAVLRSGTNVARSGWQAAVGDEAQFDFDSRPADIAEGATATIGGALGYANTNGIIGAGVPTLPANSVAHLVFGDTDNSTEQRQYRVTTAPANGDLLLGGAILSVGSVFTQADLDSGRISYLHDGSETTSDFFDYVVSDGDFVSNDTISVPQGNTPPPSRYNIELAPANDTPTITAAGSSLVVNSAATPVALPAITLADLDIAGGIGAGEQDFVQITAEFLDAADAPFAAGVLSFSGALPAGVTVTNAAGDNTVVFQGSLADVQTALNQLRAATNGSDPDRADLKIKVTVDDRLRDASGALTAGANGGTTNTDGSPINATNNVASVVLNVAASDTNDPPVITNPTPNQTVNEDVRSQITGFSFSDPDAFSSTTNTITLRGRRAQLQRCPAWRRHRHQRSGR
ncbi:MAG: hypothetical protein J0L74_13895 [Burkholderiales bacterium]|nr:hypothetical protein [Burkholderiales bacterium]